MDQWFRKNHAILRNGEVVPVSSAQEYMQWFSIPDNHRVALTKVGEIKVSTVFLGLNHAFLPTQRPLWFETMVFGGALDEESDCYATLEEAMAGHERMVARVRATVR